MVQGSGLVKTPLVGMYNPFQNNFAQNRVWIDPVVEQ